MAWERYLPLKIYSNFKTLKHIMIFFGQMLWYRFPNLWESTPLTLILHLIYKLLKLMEIGPSTLDARIRKVTESRPYTLSYIQSHICPPAEVSESFWVRTLPQFRATQSWCFPSKRAEAWHCWLWEASWPGQILKPSFTFSSYYSKHDT